MYRARIDTLCHKISALCSHHDLDENETLYITAMDTLHPRGYNLRCGSKAAAHKSDFKVSQHIIDVEEDVKDAVLDDIADLSGIDRTSLSWGGPITVTLKELNHMRGAKMNSSWAGPRPSQVKKDDVQGLFEEPMTGFPSLNTLWEESDPFKRYREAEISQHIERMKRAKIDDLMHRKKLAKEAGIDPTRIDTALEKMLFDGLE